MIREYTRVQHRFFDGLVTLLASLYGLGIGIAAYRLGPQNPHGKNVPSTIRGRPEVSGVEFVFYAYDLMQPLANNNWPDTIELHEQPFDSTSPGSIGFQKVDAFRDVHTHLITSFFVSYIDSVRPLIDARYGKVANWPTVLNFGRVLRNVIVHHEGKINFSHEGIKKVTWRTLSYSPADDGRQIIFQDLTAVEIILLMEDMDNAI